MARICRVPGPGFHIDLLLNLEHRTRNSQPSLLTPSPWPAAADVPPGGTPFEPPQPQYYPGHQSPLPEPQPDGSWDRTHAPAPRWALPPPFPGSSETVEE